MSNAYIPSNLSPQQLEFIAREYAHLESMINAAAHDQISIKDRGQSALYADPATQRIVDANATALEFLGYSKEVLFQLSINDLERAAPSAHNITNTYIEHGAEVQVYRCSYRHANGHPLPVEVRRRMISSGDGMLIHYSLEDQSLHTRVWRELERRGDGGIAFQKRLKTLNELTLELSRIESYDELCRHVIELGSERLGFDRMSMWFHDPQRGLMLGSYGIDEQGVLRAEHAESWSYKDTEIEDFITGKTETVLAHKEVPLYNQKSEVIEYGWHISAPMVYSDRVLGLLTADNYLRKQPMKDYEPELLRLYAITVGQLIELTRARDQALAMRLEQEHTQMLREFINHVGHDFRTPLATINTKSFLIQRVKEPQQRDGLVDGINEQVAYISNMIDRMLEFIKLDSKLAISFIPTDVEKLVTETVSGYYAALEEKQLRCELRLENAPSVLADAAYLQKALSEIFGNAVLYTLSGGQIQVSLAFYLHELGIRISDTGPGIEHNALEKVFKPLYRVDEARTDQHSGLGLAIAKTIVEAHYGRIVAESTVGRGSTFEVILPRTSPGRD
jgi:two-component system, sensor histidine kinase SagS